MIAPIPDPPVITPEQAAEIEANKSKIVNGRECGACALCCKVLDVPQLDAPAGQWCRFNVPGKGCGTYPTRPLICRGFYCEWMVAKGLGDEWKPDRCKFVLVKSAATRSMRAHVDPGNPTAWKKSPYYENFKIWAAEGLRQSPEMHIVYAMIGLRVVVILPDRDEDIGVVSLNERIWLDRVNGPGGLEIKVRRAAREAVV